MAHDDYNNCTDVSPACPVQATTYGYEPDLGATVFFIAFFFLLAAVQIVLGIIWKTRSFMIMMGLACACQAAGQIGRLLMHYNAWSTPGFELQICLLTFAPVFNAAAIYLTIKHITLNLDPSFSRIPPKRYPWYFLTFDFIVLVLQAAGGGTAATANTDSQRNAGTDIMVAGLVVQVVTLVVFGIVVADYFIRLRRSRGNWRIQGHQDINRFRIFMAAAVVSYVTVLVRCIYRIPELAGGWGNSLMRNENEYIALDPTMIAIASLVFTIFHPGYFFPQMRSDVRDGASKQSGFHSEDSVAKAEGYGSA